VNRAGLLDRPPPGRGDFVVRYSGRKALGVNFIVYPLLAWLWWIGGLSTFWPLTGILAVAALYSAAMAALALDRRPMFVIGESGICLPCLDDEIIAFDDLDSFWFTLHVDRSANPGGSRRWSLSLQCRPRRDIPRPLWARLRDIRTNTLLEGDVRFDCRYLSASEIKIAEQLKSRHPGGWIDSDRPSDLDAILSRGGGV
jgi:hypothetical protein